MATGRVVGKKGSVQLADYNHALARITESLQENYLRYPLQAGFRFAKVAAGNLMARVLYNVVFIYMLAVEHLNDEPASYTETPDSDKAEFYRRQTLATLNYHFDERLEDLFLGGVNIHLEHHLFPDFPPNRLREIQPLIQEICARHNVPYNNIPWGEAILGSLKTLVHHSLPWSRTSQKKFQDVWERMTRAPVTPRQPGELAEAANFQIVLGSSGRTFRMDGAKTILEALEREGIQVAHYCRKGACKTCLTGKISGVTNLEKKAPMDRITVCIAKPKSDIVLDL